MRRPRPPATLDDLRAHLDDAAVRRVLIPHDAPAHAPEERALILKAPLTAVCQVLIAEADGDTLAAIIPGGGRLDLVLLAGAVGARRATLMGVEMQRKRF